MHGTRQHKAFLSSANCHRHRLNPVQQLVKQPHQRRRGLRAVDTDTEAAPTENKKGLAQPGTILRRAPSRGRGWLAQLGGVKVMGLDPSPELVAISMVYFVQGILGLSRLAISFFYKDELRLDPAEVAFLTGLAGIPWMIKPVYGFISDSIPLWGYHRRSYLVLAGLTGVCAWSCLCFLVTTPSAAAVAMLAASLSTAASDVLVDSLVVERARDAPQAVAGSLQSLCWGSAAVGGVLSAYWSGSLVETFGTRFVFGITAFFPLVVSCAALLIDEQRIGSKSDSPRVEPPPASGLGLSETRGNSSDTLYKLPGQGTSGQSGVHHRSPLGAATPGARPDPSVWDSERAPLLGTQNTDTQAGSGVTSRMASTEGALPATTATVASGPITRGAVWPQIATRARMLWSAISRKDIFLPALFVFAWQATPSADSAMFYFQTNELGFTPEFLGRVRLVSSLASLAGVLLYNTTLKKVPLRTFLWWAMLLGVALGSTQLVLVSRLNVSLGLSDQLFVLGDAALLTALGQCSFMPILVLAARLCPQGVEATLFATLMSVLNAGSFVGSGLGAGATKLLGVTSDNFQNLFTLVLICNLGQLLPAPLLTLLPDTLDKPGDDEEAESGGTTTVVDVELQAVPEDQSPAKAGSGATGLDLGIGDVVHAGDNHNKVL